LNLFVVKTEAADENSSAAFLLKTKNNLTEQQQLITFGCLFLGLILRRYLALFY